MGVTPKARCCNGHNELEDHKNYRGAQVAGNNDQEKNSKNGYTTPYEIYGPLEVTLSDPGHWKKKWWITMYNKKLMLLTDYGSNDEST